MPLKATPGSPIHDPSLQALLARLSQDRSRPPNGGPQNNQQLGVDPHNYADYAFPISPDQGELIYLLCRAIKARRVVEFASSTGFSTLHFAAALRDNGGGTVIGAEIVSSKIETARRRLREAGLAAHAEIREGDARETLRDLGGLVDFALIDGWPMPGPGPSLARAVTEIVAPQLRIGGFLMNDNGEPDFLAFIRDPREWLHHHDSAAEGRNRTRRQSPLTPPTITGATMNSATRTPVRIRHETRLRLAEVVRVEPISPHMLRIVFGGADLAGFVSAAADDHVKLFFPPKGEDRPILPTLGPNGQSFPEDGPRPIARDYTPRLFDPNKRELVIEFVLHGEGPASEWAAQAKPGRRLGIGGPRGSVIMADDYDAYLLVGDETALPAIARRLEEMPPRAFPCSP